MDVQEIREGSFIKSRNELCTLTQSLLDEILSIFSMNCITPWSGKDLDEKSIGCIHVESFVDVARQLGCTFTASECRAILRQFRENGIKYIDVYYFVRLINNKIYLDNEIKLKLDDFTKLSDFFSDELKKCYDILDWQKGGKLAISDMKHMLSSLNDGEFDGNALNILFKHSNLKNKRIITREDFIQLFQPIEDNSFFSLRLFDN